MAPARVRITELRRKKLAGEKIVMLTAYDTPTARLLDGAGVDVVLVGDSLGMVALGHDSTLPVTLDAMVHHASAVSRGVERALLVADMPFLSYQVELSDAIRNAGRLLQEGGAAAVKVEGGRPIAEVVRRLAATGGDPPSRGRPERAGRHRRGAGGAGNRRLGGGSRNAHLSPDERQVAGALYRALGSGRRQIAAGETDAAVVRERAAACIPSDPRIHLEYLELVDPEEMQPVRTVAGPVRIAGALWVGATRLIDNVLCAPAPPRG